MSHHEKMQNGAYYTGLRKLLERAALSRFLASEEAKRLSADDRAVFEGNLDMIELEEDEKESLELQARYALREKPSLISVDDEMDLDVSDILEDSRRLSGLSGDVSSFDFESDGESQGTGKLETYLPELPSNFFAELDHTKLDDPVLRRWLGISRYEQERRVGADDIEEKRSALGLAKPRSGPGSGTQTALEDIIFAIMRLHCQAREKEGHEGLGYAKALYLREQSECAASYVFRGISAS